MGADAGAVEEGHAQRDAAVLRHFQQALPDPEVAPAVEGLRCPPPRAEFGRDRAPSKAGSRFTARTWSGITWAVCEDVPDGARATVEAWAEKHANFNTKYAVGMLGGALDALACYYGLGEPVPEILSPIGQEGAARLSPPA